MVEGLLTGSDGDQENTPTKPLHVQVRPIAIANMASRTIKKWTVVVLLRGDCQILEGRGGPGKSGDG